MKRRACIVVLALAATGFASDGGDGGRRPAAHEIGGWTEAAFESYLARERTLLSTPSRERLLRLHLMLADEPHVAGTEGDWRTIEEIAGEFRAMGSGIEGWDVEIEEFWPLLARPIDASVEIVGDETVALELRERAVPGDPASANTDPLSTLAWNAYSGSGDVTAEVVYANYGTKQDFARLRELGVDCTGRIVIARYGGNYRGYKPKYAEEAGAAGLIIFTDPADAGFARGEVYPDGGWANECCIQRGSIVTLQYQGDPLTPGTFASQEAPRLPIEGVALPRIPVQPIGYGAAAQILERMTGPEVPDSWKGGLPLTYRLTGGEGLRVRLRVEQTREVSRTANVIARLEGSGTPEERAQQVIIGCHHDAWVNGASDPTCGTIAMLEAARAFCEAARRGERPRRTIVFAAWGAEEFGIIGSSEFVERRREELTRDAIAYINLDMASMGPDFGASASPELKPLILACAKVVPAARKPEGVTVYDDWLARSQPRAVQQDVPPVPEPSVGDLGGGSDHVPFLMHAGVPSAGFGAGGCAGNSYHSVYDTLPWYWKVVGDDYEPALMVTRMTLAFASRLADSPRVAHDVARTYRELATHARAIDTLAVERGLASREGPDAWGVDALARLAAAAERRAVSETADRGMNATGRWLSDDGLPGRPWFRNWYVATDETAGYATWVLPALRKAIEAGSREEVERAAARLVEMVEQR